MLGYDDERENQIAGQRNPSRQVLVKGPNPLELDFSPTIDAGEQSFGCLLNDG